MEHWRNNIYQLQGMYFNKTGDIFLVHDVRVSENCEIGGYRKDGSTALSSV